MFNVYMSIILFNAWPLKDINMPLLIDTGRLNEVVFEIHLHSWTVSKSPKSRECRGNYQYVRNF